MKIYYLNYRNIELVSTNKIWFVNKLKDAEKLGIFAGYSLSVLKKKINKILKDA